MLRIYWILLIALFYCSAASLDFPWSTIGRYRCLNVPVQLTVVLTYNGRCKVKKTLSLKDKVGLIWQYILDLPGCSCSYNSIFLLQKVHYTVHWSTTTTPGTCLVVGHPTKRKQSAKHAIFLYNIPFLIEWMPTLTIEPNQTQSKFDWVWWLKFFVRIRLCSITEHYQSLRFNEVWLKKTFDLVQVVTPGVLFYCVKFKLIRVIYIRTYMIFYYLSQRGFWYRKSN